MTIDPDRSFVIPVKKTWTSHGVTKTLHCENLQSVSHTITRKKTGQVQSIRYIKYAWPKDSVKPASNCEDTECGAVRVSTQFFGHCKLCSVLCSVRGIHLACCTDWDH